MPRTMMGMSDRMVSKRMAGESNNTKQLIVLTMDC